MQDVRNSLLPTPDAASAAHSAKVADYLREKIVARGGQISFAEYMYHVLYAPGLGYYSAGTTKFGKAGDFVTAPEVSPVFGRVLARQCKDVLEGLAAPSVLEFGAGSGRLAVDVLQKLAQLDALPESYRILEVSADLQERQQQLFEAEIPEILDRIAWLEKLPDEHEGVIIANELLDALPVERFARRPHGLVQLCVERAGDAFAMTEREAPAELADAVAAIEADIGYRLPDDYVSEVSMAGPQWVADIAGTLTTGVAFLFDYGVSRCEYYAAERADGWLRCHFRHRAHNDPLVLAGIQDLTAWVDFTAIARAAVAAGMDVAGFVTQSQFLIGGGLDSELAGFTDLPTDAQLKLSGEVKLLTLPGEMGENFKCIGLSRGPITPPGAFERADRTNTL